MVNENHIPPIKPATTPLPPIEERRIVYLVNPISGNKDKDNLVKQLKQYSNEKALHWSIYPTNKEGNYDFIRKKIGKDKITDVVIVGGDGSVSQMVKALRDEDLRFGVIPFGSGNGLARAVGIPMNTKSALDLVIAGRSAYCDAFMINRSRFGCMLTGLGFDARIAHDFAAASTRGFKTYLEKVVANFFDARPYKFDIYTEEASFSTEAFFISFANGNQFGNNFTIAPKASVNDGLLDVVIVQKMKKLQLLGAMFMQVTGNNELQKFVEAASSKNIFYLQRARIGIRNISRAPLHIDGEPVGTEDYLDIEVIRNCFRLIQ